MEYANAALDLCPAADGFILQGPVSDREYIEAAYKAANQSMNASLDHTSQYVRSEAAKEMYMPRHLLPPEYQAGGPITVHRWHSLTSPM